MQFKGHCSSEKNRLANAELAKRKFNPLCSLLTAVSETSVQNDEGLYFLTQFCQMDRPYCPLSCSQSSIAQQSGPLYSNYIDILMCVYVLVHHKSRPISLREKESKRQKESNDYISFPFGSLTKYVFTVSAQRLCVLQHCSSYKWVMGQMRFGTIFRGWICWEKLMSWLGDEARDSRYFMTSELILIKDTEAKQLRGNASCYRAV